MKFDLFFLTALLLTNVGISAIPYINSQDTFEFSYSITLPKLEAGQAGRVWIPIASSDSFQRVHSNKETAELKVQETRDAEFKNLVMSFDISPSTSGKKLTFTYKAARSEKAPYLNPETNLKAYLESEPLVPLDERFKKLADEITRSKKTDLEKGRAIYDHVLSIMKYDKSGTGWGRGDAIYACDSKKGNCTDFHALFIAIARSAKIPSRFMVGFTIPADKNEGAIEGYHCWAEFLADGKWIPIDISEASKNPATRDYYFGHHPANRFEFTRGRHLAVNPRPQEGPINFLVYPYMEVDGKQVKATTEFSFHRLTPAEATHFLGQFPLPSPQAGIFYGDPGHALDWPDELLVKHLGELKQQGVSVIFLEHFRSTEQRLLDKFFEEPSETHLKQIMSAVKLRNKGFDQIKLGEQELLKALASQKIRPIGIELPKSNKTFNQREHHWVQTINRYLSNNPGTSWIAYVGNSHLKGGGDSDNYLGMDEKLNQPSVRLDELTETPKLWRENSK